MTAYLSGRVAPPFLAPSVTRGHPRTLRARHLTYLGETTMQANRLMIIAFAALGIAIAGAAHAEDKTKERAPVTKLLLENDKVRVAQTTFMPGDVSRADRRARVNYVVKGGKLERTNKDGKKTIYVRKAGETAWLEADSDAVKNIGKTTFVVVSTQLK